LFKLDQVIKKGNVAVQQDSPTSVQPDTNLVFFISRKDMKAQRVDMKWLISIVCF